MSKDKKKPATRGASVNSRDEAASPRPSAVSPLWARVFVWCVLGAAGLLALWALVVTTNQAAEIRRFSEQGWGQHASAIVGNQVRALWHAAFMMAVAGVALWWIIGKRGSRVEGRGAGVRNGAAAAVRSPRFVVPVLLVLIVAFDAVWFSRNYVKTLPLSGFEANPVIAILKKDTPEHRVALVSQDGFYNWWLTYLFPYHGILTVNITQMPRMPADYKAFLGAMGRNPLRMWQLSAVGYVLAPAPVWRQIQHDPAWSNAFELVCGYNVAPAEAGVTVVPVWERASLESGDRSQKPEIGASAVPPKDVGEHVVLRLLRPAPRFALIGAVRQVDDEEALKLLGSPAYELFQEVLVPPVAAGADPGRAAAEAALTNAGFMGTCTLSHYRPGRMEVEVKATKPGILRVSEKYDRDWKATVDGTPEPVQRVDFIMQGVLVPAGEHRIVLRYAPSIWPLYVQGVGMLIVLGAVGWLVGAKIRARKSQTMISK